MTAPFNRMPFFANGNTEKTNITNVEGRYHILLQRQESGRAFSYKHIRCLSNWLSHHSMHRTQIAFSTYSLYIYRPTSHMSVVYKSKNIGSSSWKVNQWSVMWTCNINNSQWFVYRVQVLNHLRSCAARWILHRRIGFFWQTRRLTTWVTYKNVHKTEQTHLPNNIQSFAAKWTSTKPCSRGIRQLSINYDCHNDELIDENKILSRNAKQIRGI